MWKKELRCQSRLDLNIELPYSNDLPMYDLGKGSTRVKLEYDPLKVSRKIRNCAKYVHRASQSAKSAAAATATTATTAKLESYWVMSLTWQYVGSWFQFAVATVAERPISSDNSVNARVGNVRGRSHLRQVGLGARVLSCQGHRYPGYVLPKCTATVVAFTQIRTHRSLVEILNLLLLKKPHISKQTPNVPMGRRNRVEVMQIRSWRLFPVF